MSEQQIPSLTIKDKINYPFIIGNARARATKCWNETGEVRHLWHAQIIRICSLFLRTQREEGLKEIHRLVGFYKVLPRSPETEWIYSKIRKYLEDTLPDIGDKKLLSAMLDFVEGKTAIGDFEKILSNKENN